MRTKSRFGPGGSESLHGAAQDWSRDEAGFVQRHVLRIDVSACHVDIASSRKPDVLQLSVVGATRPTTILPLGLTQPRVEPCSCDGIRMADRERVHSNKNLPMSRPAANAQRPKVHFDTNRRRLCTPPSGVVWCMLARYQRTNFRPAVLPCHQISSQTHR